MRIARKNYTQIMLTQEDEDRLVQACETATEAITDLMMLHAQDQLPEDKDLQPAIKTLQWLVKSLKG